MVVNITCANLGRKDNQVTTNYDGVAPLTGAVAQHFHEALERFKIDPTAEDRTVMQAPDTREGFASAWMSVELEDKMRFRAELKGIDHVFIKIMPPNEASAATTVLIMPSEAGPEDEDDGELVEDTSGSL